MHSRQRRLSSDLHQIADQLSNLSCLHLEHITERQVDNRPVITRRTHAALSDYYVVLFREPVDCDLRMSPESFIDDVLCKLTLAADVEHAGNLPLDVVRQTIEDRVAVGFPEPIHVRIDDSLVQDLTTSLENELLDSVRMQEIVKRDVPEHDENRIHSILAMLSRA